MKVLKISLIFIILAIFIISGLLAMKRAASSPTKGTSSAPNVLPQQKNAAGSSGVVPPIPFRLTSGFMIHIFAKDLGKARDLVFSPGGTLLVSNIANDQVLALADKNRDGAADANTIVIDDLSGVHGIAFYGDKLFAATTTQVIRYAWDEKNLKATKEKVLFSLPQNNNHKYRTLLFDAKGTLYVSVGSTCNVCNEVDKNSATVLISNANGDTPKIFAKGLRNAPFLAINPITNELWATEMGRDFLGDDSPPDEINIVKRDSNYGWPICYGNKMHDTNFDKNQYAPNPCEDTISPIFQIPAHSAPLGLTFINSPQFPADWQNDVLVAYHGSWNRSKPIGYKIVHMKVSGNTITAAEDFLTGFISESALVGSQADGRPVDLVFDQKGNLFVSDDKAGVVYIIQKKS